MNLAKLQGQLIPIIELNLQKFIKKQDFGSSQTLKQMINYHMGWADETAKGKRVRPLITLLCGLACGGSVETAMPAALAIELLHNFSLIHDDIQDQSPTRHGRPTLWQLWGVAQAINAGDALFSIAQLAMLELTQAADKNIALQGANMFNRTCLHLTRGQYLDLAFESDDTITPEAYLEMITGKTAALIGLSAAMGSLAAEKKDLVVGQFYDFGENLGLAFQIMDDILGIWGNPDLTGKPASTDILTRKKTLPILYGLKHSPEFRTLWKQGDLKEAQVTKMAELLEVYGARANAQEKAETFTVAAFTALGKLFPASQDENIYASALFELCEDLLRREI